MPNPVSQDIEQESAVLRVLNPILSRLEFQASSTNNPIMAYIVVNLRDLSDLVFTMLLLLQARRRRRSRKVARAKERGWGGGEEG